MEEVIIILDFGSQYTQLIARRVREHNVYCEILPFNTDIKDIKSKNPRGIILSGGPSSVFLENAPLPSDATFTSGIPLLGICYGLQMIGKFFKGKVSQAKRREYGYARFVVDDKSNLFHDLPESFDVWMSHGDHIEQLPEGFIPTGHTENAPIAAIADPKRKIFGIQFHPEVVHTSRGSDILANFLFRICNCSGNWTPEQFADLTIERIKEKVGDSKVICGVSGGVDSTVTAYLLHRAIGDNFIPIFVNNGLLRKGEAEEVRRVFSNMELHYIDASDEFLRDLKQVVDPEKKRKIIGKKFIDIFEREAKKVGNISFLAQGTLYPDVIESISTWGPSDTIKSHHNVGGLPDKMNLCLIEPLRELFKDEVREVGKVLNIDKKILMRHPFPGPGLAIRILGEITEKRLKLLRDADDIFITELKKSGWYDKVWQALVVLLPIQSVGVMGDERTYENVASLRSVNSLDGMTADWSKFPMELLQKVSNRIINEIKGINRVVYDISSKPPATIEWE
ncbi:MAG: glutamine-hydrolyzing GMP synthase [bacterium]